MKDAGAGRRRFALHGSQVSRTASSRSSRCGTRAAQAKRVLARQIRSAYAGLFQTDENAQDLSIETVKDRLASLTGKDESVVKKMASTSKALAGQADFSAAPQPQPKDQKAEEEAVESPALEAVTPRPQSLAFAHTLYINLPTTRDSAVFDAIFKSIREHLL